MAGHQPEVLGSNEEIMRFQILIVGFLLVCLLACGPAPEELAFQTQEAATAIAARWTETTTLTLNPSATLTPADTQTILAAPTIIPSPTPTPTPEWPKVYTQEELLDLTANLFFLSENAYYKTSVHEIPRLDPEQKDLVNFEAVSTGNFMEARFSPADASVFPGTAIFAEFASRNPDNNPFTVWVLVQVSSDYDDQRNFYFQFRQKVANVLHKDNPSPPQTIEWWREFMPPGLIIDCELNRFGESEVLWITRTTMLGENWEQRIRDFVQNKYPEDDDLRIFCAYSYFNNTE